MKAILQHKFGAPDAVLRLGDVEKPVVGDDDVLVRVGEGSPRGKVVVTVSGT